MPFDLSPVIWGGRGKESNEMKRIFLWIIIFTLLLVGCEQQGGGEPIVENDGTAVGNVTETAEIVPTDDAAETVGDAVEIGEEPAGPEVFVPISVEGLGLTTVVPADWPQIEGDPLLKNAWGPGEFRFVAFHSVPGEDMQLAMAQLLGTSLEELLEGPVDGDYWEEQIGSYDWAMYTVDNPDIGLGQSVSMTVQDGTVYIVSLFVEMDYRDTIQNTVLENFNIGSETGRDEAEVVEEETGDGGDVSEIDLMDTSWALAMFGDSSGQLQEVLPGVEITAVFSADNRVAGSSGCNSYASLYTIDDNIMTISVPAMTRMTCDDPEGIMLQETSFLGNLTSVASYQIGANELQLLDIDESVILIFLSP